jgi:sigma-B regulation protein RsbU (phosphoserine phosphatase)
MREEVRNRARLETEVKIAQNIQQSLIPCATFENSWCKVAGMMSSATEVGGDYFDIISLSDHQLVVAIADVAGHGVGSGILSAMTKSAFRSQLMHDASPAKLLENLNQTIFQVSQRNMFVTFAYLLLDERTHTAAYATAGHPPLLFLSNGAQRYLQLRTSNPALGLQQASQFVEACVSFSSGDSFILYTDGIIEAVDTKGKEFGIDRLQDQVAQQQSCTGSDLCSRIVDSVRRYTGTDAFKDDVTVVSVKLSR